MITVSSVQEKCKTNCVSLKSPLLWKELPLTQTYAASPLVRAAPENQPCVAQQETKSCTNDSAPYRLSDQATLGGASSRGARLFLPSQSQLPASLMQVNDYVQMFSHGLVTFNGLLNFPLNLANQSL